MTIVEYPALRARLVLAFLCGLAGPAQVRADAPADAALASQLDTLLARWDTTVTPGGSIAVERDGRTVYSRGFGMADLEHGVPNRPETVFHVASVSKQFTAAAIVLLALEGKLSLDDSVRKHVPELPDFGVPITIRHLVHHTSGLRDQWDILEVSGWRYSHDLITDEDVLSVLALQKELNFPPGTQYSYSNSGYTLLAQIVQRVSGQTLRRFTTARLFEPLGMLRTRFRDDFMELVPDLAPGYTQEQGAWKSSVTNFNTVGATSLVTTAEDLIRWQEGLYAGRIGGGAFLDQMLERGTLSDGARIDYAFGLVHGSHRGLVTVDHEGADAGYVSCLVWFPDHRLSIAVLCNNNRARPTELAREVANVYLAPHLRPIANVEAAAAAPTPERIQSALGTFLHRADGRSCRLVEKDGKLCIAAGDRVSELTPSGENRFRREGGWTEIELVPGSGPVDQLIQRRRNGKPETFERVPAFQPTPAELDAYRGAYESEEIQTPYRIAVRESRLALSALKLHGVDLEPVTRDVFKGEWLNVTFDRDARGEVSGLRLNTSGLETYRFRRK